MICSSGDRVSGQEEVLAAWEVGEVHFGWLLIDGFRRIWRFWDGEFLQRS